MSDEVANWLFDSYTPSVRSLPHMGQRAAEFAAGATGPNGERLVVKPSLIGRVLSVFRRDNDDELERLRRMLREVGE